MAVGVVCAAVLTLGCGSSGETVSGAAFAAAGRVRESAFSPEQAEGGPGGLIDTSHLSEGYVSASATSSARLKFQVTSGEQSYNYDLPSDGTPIACPLNMGDGSYQFRVMRNTEGTSYVEVASTTAQVQLASEFEPFLHPNVFCNYNEGSACVAKARELVANASNQGEAVKNICTYVIGNTSYDKDKAAELKDATGYVPNPDDTLASRTGICFDYASLGCAMLRSVGIPCRLTCGYVSPGDIYHAWILVYIDGTWKTVKFTVDPNTWSRVDLTFAAASDAEAFVGDGKTYTVRYVY
jgi:transglutaminase-like putative cysteine protease